jgi:predicted component of type VI protein secretion system
MTNIHVRWRMLAAAGAAAAALAGCGGNGETTVPNTPPPPQTVEFSIFATQAFSNNANSSPVSVDVNFTFDVNDDPTAFDSLIANGAF